MEEITVRVGEEGRAAIERRVARLAKRAAKLGMDQPSVTSCVQGEDHRAKDDQGVWHTWKTWNLTLICPGSINIGGWRVFASIDHDAEHGNIVSSRETEGLSAEWGRAEANCDHCGLTRTRKTTVLIAKDDRVMQIGKSCLADFLDDEQAAERAEIWADWIEILGPRGDTCIDDDLLKSGASIKEWPLARLMNLTALMVDNFGWFPKSAESELVIPTSVEVWEWVNSRLQDSHNDLRGTPEAVLADDDEPIERTTQALEYWAANTDQGDYAANIKALIRRGWVTQKQFGLAVSALPVAERGIARAAEKAAELTAAAAESIHVGAIGKRESFGPGKIVGLYETWGDYGPRTRVGIRLTNGASLSWWASKSADSLGLAIGDNIDDIVATVKDHGQYRGVAQTMITRAKITKNCLVA